MDNRILTGDELEQATAYNNRFNGLAIQPTTEQELLNRGDRPTGRPQQISDKYINGGLTKYMSDDSIKNEKVKAYDNAMKNKELNDAVSVGAQTKEKELAPVLDELYTRFIQTKTQLDALNRYKDSNSLASTY